MTGRLEICAVSGGRADYGLLLPVLKALSKDAGFGLQLILTGQHLVREAGSTAADARAEGFAVTEVDMQLLADDPVSISRAAGRALAGISDALAHLKPDMLLILGDRYEILCAAVAATIARVPIVHIAGGDITEGAFDDAFRHAITKLAHIHLVTNADAARRVRQLGESPERVHIVGSPGLDLVRTTRVPSREEFFAAIGLQPQAVNLIVTFHPATLAKDSVADLEKILKALTLVGDDTAILFTGSNADPDGRRIDARVQEFVACRGAMRFKATLGNALFYAALSHMDAMVGNSSSGLYEAPSFGIPTVNIGDRQKGRLRASSVIDCAAERRAIHAAIGAALTRGRKPSVNPFGDGRSSERIIALLKSIDDPRSLLVKRFAELEAA